MVQSIVVNVNTVKVKTLQYLTSSGHQVKENHIHQNQAKPENRSVVQLIISKFPAHQPKNRKAKIIRGPEHLSVDLALLQIVHLSGRLTAIFEIEGKSYDANFEESKISWTPVGASGSKVKGKHCIDPVSLTSENRDH